jgi:hypothetical protein
MNDTEWRNIRYAVKCVDLYVAFLPLWAGPPPNKVTLIKFCNCRIWTLLPGYKGRFWTGFDFKWIIFKTACVPSLQPIVLFLILLTLPNSSWGWNENFSFRSFAKFQENYFAFDEKCLWKVPNITKRKILVETSCGNGEKTEWFSITVIWEWLGQIFFS